MFVQTQLAGTGRHQICPYLKVDGMVRGRQAWTMRSLFFSLITLLEAWHCLCSPHRASASLQLFKADVEAGKMLREAAGNSNGAKKREMGAVVPLSLPSMIIHMDAA